MATAALHGLFDIQSSTSSTSPPLASPLPTHQKPSTTENHPPSKIELDDLTFGSRYNGPPTDPSTPKGTGPSGTQTPKTPNELEMSRPGSPTAVHGASVMQTWKDPSMNKWRILSCCLIYFGNGMSDSGTPSLSSYRLSPYPPPPPRFYDKDKY